MERGETGAGDSGAGVVEGLPGLNSTSPLSTSPLGGFHKTHKGLKMNASASRHSYPCTRCNAPILTPGAANDAGHSSEDHVEEDRVVRTTPAGEEVGGGDVLGVGATGGGATPREAPASGEAQGAAVWQDAPAGVNPAVDGTPAAGS